MEFGFLVFLAKFSIMQEANLASLLKTIFYIFLFYYLFKFVARLLLPVLAQKVVEKANQQMEDKFRQHQNQSTQTQQEPQKKKEVVGEYIDFEEVE